jgi:hypothetical protein
MSFKEFLNEGADEAKIIRTAIKNKLGLTSRDVSVKARSGGTSSSVTVSLKTTKALSSMTKIKDLSKDSESYERDASGDILGGGNTFIFTSIDRKLEDELSIIVQAEFDKLEDEFEENDRVKLFGTFDLVRSGRNLFFRVGRVQTDVRQLKYLAGPLLFLIQKTEDDTLYSKIK